MTCDSSSSLTFQRQTSSISDLLRPLTDPLVTEFQLILRKRQRIALYKYTFSQRSRITRNQRSHCRVGSRTAPDHLDGFNFIFPCALSLSHSFHRSVSIFLFSLLFYFFLSLPTPHFLSLSLFRSIFPRDRSFTFVFPNICCSCSCFCCCCCCPYQVEIVSSGTHVCVSVTCCTNASAHVSQFGHGGGRVIAIVIVLKVYVRVVV